MSRAFCLVCGAHEVRSPPQVFTQNISYSVVYVSTLMAILIMGKYAISKLSVILYHKQMNLSIGFIKFLKNIFSNCLLVIKKDKESCYRGVWITL